AYGCARNRYDRWQAVPPDSKYGTHTASHGRHTERESHRMLSPPIARQYLREAWRSILAATREASTAAECGSLPPDRVRARPRRYVPRRLPARFPGSAETTRFRQF